MLNIAAHTLAGGSFVFDSMGGDDSDGFILHFSLRGKYAPSRVHEVFGNLLKEARLEWIRPRREQWEINLDGARAQFNDILKAEWIRGYVNIEPEITGRTNTLPGEFSEDTFIGLRFVREEILLKQQSRIFLSHKGANKSLLVQFHRVLKELGFDPWLDQEDMVSGDTLHRELLAGMQASCAAVFFITPEFRDETYGAAPHPRIATSTTDKKTDGDNHY
jgi:TIR domain